jgi:hypothetical protein
LTSSVDIHDVKAKERRYPLRDNASLLLNCIGLGYGSISFSIKRAFADALFYSPKGFKAVILLR